jgi:predicted ATP-grasp superfamily ATP-dependent carboligase
MKSIGYRGILDIGYRYDSRDGKYKVLDINPRIGSTFRLFKGSNGLDVARVAYLDLTGQHVPKGWIIEGRKWLVEDGDISSCIQYFCDKKLTPRQWIKSYRGVKEGAWFSWVDPVPFVMIIPRIAREAVRRLIKPLFRKMQRLIRYRYMESSDPPLLARRPDRWNWIGNTISQESFLRRLFKASPK